MSALLQLENRLSHFEPLLKGWGDTDINGKKIRELVQQSIREIYIPELDELEQEICTSQDDIIAVASDYSGKYVILALSSSKIKVVDVKSHEDVCEVQDTGLIHQLFFLQDSDMLYYYTYDGSFYQMKAEFQSALCGLPTLVNEKKEAIYCLVEGTKLFAVAYTETCKLDIFDSQNHKCETIGTFVSEPIQMCSSQDQQYIFLLCSNKNFYIWSLKRGESVFEITFDELPLNFVANDNHLVLQYKGFLSLFNLETSKYEKEIECNSNLFVFDKVFLSNYLMIDMPKGRIVMLKMNDLQEECTLYKPRPEEEQVCLIQRVAQSGNLECLYLVKNYKTLIKLKTANRDLLNSTIYKVDSKITHLLLGEDGSSFSFSTSKGQLYEAREEQDQCLRVDQVDLEHGAPLIFTKRKSQNAETEEYFTFTKGEQDDEKEQQQRRDSHHMNLKYPRKLNYLRYEKTRTKRSSWLDTRQLERQSIIFGKSAIQPKTIEILSDESVRAIALTQDDNFIIIGNEAGEIKLFDYSQKCFVGVFGWHASKIKNLVVSRKTNKCFSSSNDGTIGAWNIPLPKANQEREVLPHTAGGFLKTCASNFKRNYKKHLKIQIRNNHELEDQDDKVFEPELQELLQLSSLSINWIQLTPDQGFLVAGASSGHVLLWNISQGRFDRVLARHKHPVKRVMLSSTQKAMISYDTGSIFIIDLTYEPHLSSKVLFHQSVNIQAALHLDKGIIVIDMRGNVDYIPFTFQKLRIRVSQAFPVSFPVNYQSLTRLGKDGNLCTMEVVYSPDGKIEFFPSTFKKYGFRSDFCTWKRHIFLYKMKHESLTRNIKYFKGFETFLSEFSQFSMLHIYAFYSQIDLIKQALLTAPLLPEPTNGISPLRVSLAINDFKAIHVFVNYLVQNQSEMSYNDWGFLEKDLIELNRVKYRNIHMIYQNLGVEPSIDLPETGDLRGQEQIVILLNAEELNCPIRVQEGNVNRLEWRLSRIPFEFAVGSQESVDFLVSMRDSHNLEIFKSPFIQAYIDQKWKTIRPSIAIEAIVHALFIAFLLQTILVGRMERINLLMMLGFAILYLLFELFEFLVTMRVYFKQLSNYNDIFGPLMMIYYYVSAVIYNEPSLWCLSMMTLHAFFKGLNYFTLSKNLRFFVRFLKQIFIDMIPFSMVLLFCTFLFSMTFISSTSNTDIDVFAEFFTMYRLNIGDFDTSGYSYLEMVIFVVVSWITNIILLNLIISLMGDTYDRVQTNRTASDQEELLDAIIEYENKFVWNRKKSTKKYILLAKQAGNFDEPDSVDWQGKVSILKYKIEEIGREMAEKQNASYNLLRKLTAEMSDMRISTNKLKKARVQ